VIRSKLREADVSDHSEAEYMADIIYSRRLLHDATNNALRMRLGSSCIVEWVRLESSFCFGSVRRASHLHSIIINSAMISSEQYWSVESTELFSSTQLREVMVAEIVKMLVRAALGSLEISAPRNPRAICS
jgi:hypothetical protein